MHRISYRIEEARLCGAVQWVFPPFAESQTGDRIWGESDRFVVADRFSESVVRFRIR